MHTNWFILILSCLIILIYLFIRGMSNDGIRMSLLKTFISLSYIVFFSTELLGMTSQLYGNYLEGLYLFFITIAIFAIIKFNIQGFEIFKSDILKIRQEFILYFSGWLRYLFLFFLGITLFLSIYVAPNNTDALGYHIARVMFWAQNHSLYHFPTQFSPQLYYNVMSEYFFLHLYLLTGADYFFNCVQWCALLICLIAVSSLLRIWGASKSVQGLGVILTLTIPQALLQATSSQNDLLSASYFIVSIYFGYQIVKIHFSWQAFFWGISALLLGGFTKYSVFIFGLPLIIYFAITQIRVKFSRALLIGVTSVLLFAVIFGNFFYRNFQLMGELIAPDSASPLFIGNYTSDLMSWKSLISNLLKIGGNHLALPFNAWNARYDKLVYTLHESINFPVNSKLTAFDTYNTAFTIGEDFSGNFIHFVCLLIALFFVVIRKLFLKLPQVGLLILLTSGFLIYAEIFKWQRFHARTQLPFFVATIPILVFLLAHYIRLKDKHIRLVSLLFLLQALPFLLFNTIKPIFPISYGFKRFIHYLPASISSNQTKGALFTKLIDSHVYSLAPDNRAIRLQNLTKKEAKKGFDLLDEMGIFEQDKLWIGSSPSRFSHYVLFNKVRYDELEQIFKALGPHRKRIGFQSRSSFVSPFFFMGKKFVGPDFELNYIQYPAIFLKTFNTKSEFQYEAILSDDQAFIAKFPSILGRVIRFKTWSLILLNKPSSHVYLE